MSRPYRKIIAEYHRQYPHQVRLANTGDWRFDHCSRAHYQVTRDRLVWGHEDGFSVSRLPTRPPHSSADRRQLAEKVKMARAVILKPLHAAEYGNRKPAPSGPQD